MTDCPQKRGKLLCIQESEQNIFSPIYLNIKFIYKWSTVSACIKW